MNTSGEPTRQGEQPGGVRVIAALIAHRNDKQRSARVSLPKEIGDVIYTNPFAFLVGAAFDRGMPWQKAWEIPYWIDQKGQLEASKLAAMEEPDLERLLESLPIKASLRMREGCANASRCSQPRNEIRCKRGRGRHMGWGDSLRDALNNPR